MHEGELTGGITSVLHCISDLESCFMLKLKTTSKSGRGENQTKSSDNSGLGTIDHIIPHPSKYEDHSDEEEERYLQSNVSSTGRDKGGSAAS